MISNTLHINAECSCERCTKHRTRIKIYASRAKLERLILQEIRALAGKSKSVNHIAADIAGKIEMFYVESL